MKFIDRIFVGMALPLVLLSLARPRTVEAQQNWKATLGAQNKDMGKQVIAFLPNELWIHVNDSVTWTSATGEIHTVSFLKAGQVYEDFHTGCPGFTANPSTFDGSTCVSSNTLVAGQSFTVKFSKTGNYKLLCLVHPHMSGIIHVLVANAALPHDQYFYDEQAEKQTRALLSDSDNDREHHSHQQMEDMLTARVWHGNGVAAGIGEVNATAGGFQSLSVQRFLNGTITVHAGDTVEWSVLDPAEPHTITFGTEPLNPGPPSPDVTFDADGGRHATLKAPGGSTHSGVIGAVPMNQAGAPQSPATIPVFRVTFLRAGTYDYKCALHDNLGMVGKVVVEP